MISVLIHSIPKWQWFIDFCLLLPIAIAVWLYENEVKTRFYRYASVFQTVRVEERQMVPIAKWCKLYIHGHDRLYHLSLQGMIDKHELDLDKEFKEYMKARGFS